MSKIKIIFRADGNSIIGLGHVIRSLALAEMLYKNFECIFAIQNSAEPILNIIRKIIKSVIELPLLPYKDSRFYYELDPYLKGSEIVVLDGYNFDTGYQQSVKSKCHKLVCIDDIHTYHFLADVILNHAGGVSADAYSKESYTTCYLGPQYALLRPPFLKKQDNFPTVNITRLFLNMGGADPENYTCKVLSQLKNYAFFSEIHIVIGPAFNFLAELHVLLLQDQRCKIYADLNAEEIANLMAGCGTAICPPSTVSYEYASINGLLFLFQTAENQKNIRKYFLKNKLALDYELEFGKIILNNSVQSADVLLKNQKQIFDRESPERLNQIFKKLAYADTVILRDATEKDILICFEWANDPQTRRLSFNSKPIHFDDHLNWFSKKLQDNDCKFYIAECNDKPVGQIRFEGRYEKIISYVIAPEMRGQGLGHILLRKGIQQLLLEQLRVEKISGYVKKTNIASCKIFENAGFELNKTDDMPFPDTLKFEVLTNKIFGNYNSVEEV